MEPWRRLANQSEDQMHALFALRPLAPLDTVYEDIFHKVLGQKLSKAAPNVALAGQGLQIARDRKKPLLFVIHRYHNNSAGLDAWKQFRSQPSAVANHVRNLLQDYVVILVPLKEMPALSQRLKRPPYELGMKSQMMFVVARSDGEQLANSSGNHVHGELAHALAEGWVDALTRRSAHVRELRNASRAVGRLDPQLAKPLHALVQQKTTAKGA